MNSLRTGLLLGRRAWRRLCLKLAWHQMVPVPALLSHVRVPGMYCTPYQRPEIEALQASSKHQSTSIASNPGPTLRLPVREQIPFLGGVSGCCKTPTAIHASETGVVCRPRFCPLGFVGLVSAESIRPAQLEANLSAKYAYCGDCNALDQYESGSP